ncbi:glycoside hydrolase family 27 protein [Tsukamurella soli]|uniref:glycoside hydrolase family 27 protein n=1 Tax=Tsukamurella soli TaxID=644556 RepID=UPI00360F72B9
MNIRRSAPAAVAVVALVAATATASVSHAPVRYPPGAKAADTAVPLMGWNSWNLFGCNVNEHDVEAEADALVSSGLAARGYRTVTVDDCWFDPRRAPDGSLRADPQRFPHGMAALGRFLHARGLRFGIYESPNARTCAQFAGTYRGSTGSLGHETQDARTFASWGVDFLKYDWCATDSDPQRQVNAFARMRDALRATGRSIVYAINPNSDVAGAVPGPTVDWSPLANQVRTTNDVIPAWRTRLGRLGDQGIGEALEQAPAPTTPGVASDMDMLVVGFIGVSPAEARTQVAMWSMFGSPLIATNDITRMSTGISKLLGDPLLIAIDQDPSAPARRVGQAWVRRLSDGRLAVAFVDDSPRPVRLGATPSALGWTGPAPTVAGAWGAPPRPASRGSGPNWRRTTPRCSS